MHYPPRSGCTIGRATGTSATTAGAAAIGGAAATGGADGNGGSGDRRAKRVGAGAVGRKRVGAGADGAKGRPLEDAGSGCGAGVRTGAQPLAG